MQEDHSIIIKAFFKYMGSGFLILCIKVGVIGKISLELVRSLWYTFMYCYTVAIWIGLAGMVSSSIYIFIKKNFLNLKLCLYNA